MAELTLPGAGEVGDFGGATVGRPGAGRPGAGRPGAGKHILLIGFMGAGKTSVGQKLAADLGLACVDADDQIVRDLGCSLSEYFARAGEAAFREHELAFLRSLSQYPTSIVACGGGIVTLPACRAELRRQGFVVWLDAQPATVFERVTDTQSRPLLSDLEAAEALYARRLPWYKECADIRVDTDDKSVEAVVEVIRQGLEQHQLPHIMFKDEPERGL